MSDDHEVYPNAPLALVVVEIRFSNGASDRPLPMPLQRTIRDALGEEWVIDSSKIQRFDLSIGPNGPAPQFMAPVPVTRFTVRDRTKAIALTESTLTIEATEYSHYPAFRETLELAISAISTFLKPDGINRVGMRYIDEIRIPEITDSNIDDWSKWLHPSLSAPCADEMAAANIEPLSWEGAAQYNTGIDQRLVLRYGSRSGFVVSPVGPLMCPHPPLPGALFFLDFDSYWEPQGIPEFTGSEVLERCDSLRSPIRSLFDFLTTENLLKEFRKVTESE